MPKVSEAYLEERRQQILDAAITCFARKGFYQTTMEDIGKEAGVSPGVAYRYFPGKEAIIETIMIGGMDRKSGLLGEMEDGGFLHILDAFTQAWFGRLEQPEADNYYRMRVMAFAEQAQNQDTELSRKMLNLREIGIERLENTMRRWQERGQLNPDLDPRAIAQVFIAIFDGLMMHWATHMEMDTWKTREVVMALFSRSFLHGEIAESE